MRTRFLLSIVFTASPLLAQAPVADFSWDPVNPPINSVVTIRDLSSGATSTSLLVENSHPQPGAGAQLFFDVARRRDTHGVSGVRRTGRR